MPSYPFTCDSCGWRHLVRCSFDDKPDQLICPECGDEARQVFCAPEVLVAGKRDDFQTDPTKPGSVCANMARRHGRSAAEQQRVYNDIISDTRKRVKQANREKKLRAPGSEDIRLVGQVPRELFQSRQNQYGKMVWTDDPKGMLKREGLYFGDD